jgi:hypothetical protein
MIMILIFISTKEYEIQTNNPYLSFTQTKVNEILICIQANRDG